MSQLPVEREIPIRESFELAWRLHLSPLQVPRILCPGLYEVHGQRDSGQLLTQIRARRVDDTFVGLQ